MYRFDLEVYFDGDLVFSKVFKSLTAVCKCIDCFEYEKVRFLVTDSIKGRLLDSKELMRIWHQ